MKLAALYSRGKDSTFAISCAQDLGHRVACLITMHPIADDSALFHYPNSWVTEYLADAMQIPLMGFQVCARSKEDEMKALEEAIVQVKSLYEIDGIVYVVVFQATTKSRHLSKVCDGQRIAAVAPLWNSEPERYVTELVLGGFHYNCRVSTMGSTRDGLAGSLTRKRLTSLMSVSKKCGFNLTFEGGEAETLVIDCPLYCKRLQINGYHLLGRPEGNI